MLPITTEKQLSEAVEATDDIIENFGIVERAAKQVSSKSEADYRKQSASRIDLDCEDGGRLLTGVSKQSFNKMKAALLYVLCRECVRFREECRIALQNMLQAQTDKGRSEAFVTASKAASKAWIAATSFRAVQESSAPPERSTPNSSQRKSLPSPSIKEDWRQMAFEAASPAKKRGIAALWSGARPAEIEEGIEVSKGTHQGKPTISVYIRGAKIGPDSGQEYRTVIFDANSPIGRALTPYAGQMGDPKTIERGAKRLNNDSSDMRKRGQLPADITPYSFRHQFCSDLKVERRPREEIAKAMGHANLRSQNKYGSVKQGRDGLGLVAVEAARDVRTEWNRGPNPEKSPLAQRSAATKS